MRTDSFQFLPLGTVTFGSAKPLHKKSGYSTGEATWREEPLIGLDAPNEPPDDSRETPSKTGRIPQLSPVYPKNNER